MMRRQRAFTIVELMIAVALVAVILALAAPAFRDLIVMQRLKGAAATLATDMQYGRSEAVSRGNKVWVFFKYTTAMSCYSIFTDSVDTPTSCDCAHPPGAGRCLDTGNELRTAQVPSDLSIQLAAGQAQPAQFAFDPTTGGISFAPSDSGVPPPAPYKVDASIDTPRTLRTIVGVSGRPQTCLPAGASVNGGYQPCP